ncbi:unnamed protein product [Aspergillus oryzae var. brunneus]|uniref:Unnamed protein product n=2 Tax=Aspergillus oryzae TaxID=5062 RepID=A0AAN4YU46_ASPOZ|nr:unnamed protein product [Aspergillus oryzae]GMG50502.1 unnamed protein product [Aspergillus oryzae var. brunneus]
MLVTTVSLLALSAVASAHGKHQTPMSGPHQKLWYNTLPGDGGTQVCVKLRPILYIPFSGGYNVPLEANPFVSDLKVIDCGDIPVTSYDNAWAIQQIEEGHNSILMRKPFTDANEYGLSRAGKTLPRVITLGGDHTITLPLLRSINKAYGPVSVIHFDSHLYVLNDTSPLFCIPELTFNSDSWKPKVFGGSPSQVASVNHGTYFYHAAMEGLLKNDTNIHAGIRTTLSGPSDYENDGYCGFEIVEAREIDTIGTDGIIKRIRDRVGTENPVYLSIDIDTLDPACKSFQNQSTPTYHHTYPPLFIMGLNLPIYKTMANKTMKIQMPPQPAPLKQVAGQPANCARSSVV